ncbi:MAG: hypothetical protein R3251_00930 [Candidatus Spechtbacterales bacterium]|nr:hypothetical protein [Candidatus Spechtbacterales bacterium]
MSLSQVIIYVMKYIAYLVILISIVFIFYTPTADAALPADFGLNEGNLISASGDPDIYIVNEHGYKRLFLNPEIFNFYGHLGGFSNVTSITPGVRDAFSTVSYVRNCETNDPKVYAVEVVGEDAGTLHWFNMTGEAAVAEDPEFFKKIFCINNNEFKWYTLSSEYSSTADVQSYSRDTLLADVLWRYSGSEWEVVEGVAPTCPDSIVLNTPVDLSVVDYVIYPGQYRGGDYKAHGGFRFDSSSYDEISIYAPMDGKITQGVRYTEGGEIQYMFDFFNDCGIRYRFDHLRILSNKLQQIADNLPEPIEGDTRTTRLDEPVAISAGELIATGVGTPTNVFVDWGVYDLRQKNSASADANWFAEHDKAQDAYAVCWFDWLSTEDSATVRSLPASGGDAQSDYCD